MMSLQKRRRNESRSRRAISFCQRNIKIDEASPVQSFFGEMPESYIVLPRVVLQSLSLNRQREFIEIMQEIEAEFVFPQPGHRYRVEHFASDGRMATDPMWDHGFGRRKL